MSSDKEKKKTATVNAKSDKIKKNNIASNDKDVNLQQKLSSNTKLSTSKTEKSSASDTKTKKHVNINLHKNRYKTISKK